MEDELFNAKVVCECAQNSVPTSEEIDEVFEQCKAAITKAAQSQKNLVLLNVPARLRDPLSRRLLERKFDVHKYSDELIGVHWYPYP